MLLTSLISLLFAVGTAAIPRDKRDTYTGQTIYAYGTGISGLPILADSSGIAYVSSATASNLTSLAWTINDTGDEPWNVTAASNTTTTTTTSTFYIVTTADAYSPVGFIGSNTTAPSGAETVGFTLYGSDVSFLSGTVLESQFWAKAAGATEWVIYWNVNGTSQPDSVPVTLKMDST